MAGRPYLDEHQDLLIWVHLGYRSRGRLACVRKGRVAELFTCSEHSAWLLQDRLVSGQDPVLWHSFGITHHPRIEDFPVM